MKNTFLSIVVLVASMSSYAQEKAVSETSFGKEVNIAQSINVDELYVQMKENKELFVNLKGQVEGVCQKKGCWMKLSGSNGELLHVTFKDYALFMPTAIDGKEVVISGKAWVNVTPVDELRHYAEDAGKSKKEIAAIKEAKTEVRFEADGVQILN